MESKRKHMGHRSDSPLQLLIEPVWNRNDPNRALTYSAESPFNRTSMESKRLYAMLCRRRNSSFNRTSMESKRFGQEKGLGEKMLLIEPVWNRNWMSVSIM